MSKAEAFQEKVAKNPDNMMFRFSLGQALYEDGKLIEAIPHLTLCAESRSDWMLPRILLGKAFVTTGELSLARPHLEEALQLAIDQHHKDPEAELRSIIDDL